jgi:hypothetical protein
MEKLKCKVVMLPTEKASPLVYNNSEEGLFCVKGIGILAKHRMGNCTNQSLYFVSNREIKEDVSAMDYYIDSRVVDTPIVSRTYLHRDKIDFCAKIEATTDPSLDLPLIPQSFIEKYVEKQGKIEEVMIDLVRVVNCPENHFRVNYEVQDNMTFCPKCIVSIIPKTRKDNTVIVSPIKDSWTREEVVNLIRNFRNDILIEVQKGGVSNFTEEWINKNL